MNTKSSRYACVFLTFCCLLFAFAANSSRAQSTQGTILGTVKDTTGSVIPGADIKITNQDEGATLYERIRQLPDPRSQARPLSH